jgi:hypothetical protein
LIRRSRRRRGNQFIAGRRSKLEPARIFSRLPVSGDRKSLLLGTALASTLLIGGILMPAPAGAVVNSCTDPGPDAVFINSAAPIQLHKHRD